jgi:hypothetical protein
MVAARQAHDLGVEARRIAPGPDLHRDALEPLGIHRGRALRDGSQRAPHEIEREHVARPARPIVDGIEAGVPLAQALEHRVDRLVGHLDALPPQRQRREIDRVNRRHRLEHGREGERLALLERQVADVGRVDRVERPLAERVVEQPGHELVRHVVQDPVAEPLPDDRGRRLARAEPGHAGRARVVARHAGDLGLDRVGGDLEHDLLLGRADVDDLCLHERCRVAGGGATRVARSACRQDETITTCYYETAPAWRLVRKGGLEPPRPFGHRILSPARLPVPPLSRSPGSTPKRSTDRREEHGGRPATPAASVSLPEPPRAADGARRPRPRPCCPPRCRTGNRTWGADDPSTCRPAGRS